MLGPFLLYVSREESLCTYTKIFEDLKVPFHATSSILEFVKKNPGFIYQGLLLDVPSAIKASSEDKGLIQELVGVYPSLYIKINSKSEEVRTYMPGRCSRTRVSLQDFIFDHCSSFVPRSPRMFRAASFHLPLLLSPHREFSLLDTEKTVTLDISDGGCFAFSSRQWEVSDKVWLRFVSLDDPAPIQGEVRWSVPWGESTAMPGIGVEFKNIAPSQLQVLKALASSGYSSI